MGDAVQEEIRRRKEIGTAAQVYSAQSWSAEIATVGTGVRPCTRPINTAPQSGAAIKSTLTGSADAVLRSLPKKRLKTDSFLHSTASFLPKSPTSKPAKRQNKRLRIRPPLTPRWRTCSNRSCFGAYEKMHRKELSRCSRPERIQFTVQWLC